jgi:hypothetical protein
MRGCELEVTDAGSAKPLFPIGRAFLVGQYRRAQLPKALGRKGSQKSILVLEVPVRGPRRDAQLAPTEGLDAPAYADQGLGNLWVSTEHTETAGGDRRFYTNQNLGKLWSSAF